MRAISVLTHGGPEALQVFDVPEMQAGPGQLRVRVHAAAVNPTDVLARNGSRAELQKVDPPPYVPGMGIAGIIDQVGEGVTTGARVGDRVMAMVVPKGARGAYSGQIVLEQRAVANAPAGLSFVQACTLPMNGLTAMQSLDLLGLTAGQTLAVTGAAGAYGGYVIQLAKVTGLTVIADAAHKNRELVASLGADIVVRRGDDVAHRIREQFPDGVDGLADGAVLNERAVAAVRDGGAFTAVRGFEGFAQRRIRFSVTSVRRYDAELKKLERLRQLAEFGALTLRVVDTFAPEQAGGSASSARGRRHSGKVSHGMLTAAHGRPFAPHRFERDQR